MDSGDQLSTPDWRTLFFLGCASLNVPVDFVSDADICSRNCWKHAQVMANHFWRRWLHEYLPSLTVRLKCNIAEGDLVWVMADNLPRGRWPIPRATRVVRWRRKSTVCWNQDEARCLRPSSYEALHVRGGVWILSVVHVGQEWPGRMLPTEKTNIADQKRTLHGIMWLVLAWLPLEPYTFRSERASLVSISCVFYSDFSSFN